MLKKISYLLLAVVFAISLAALISNDVRRFFSFYAAGETNILQDIPLSELSPHDAGAYYFIAGDYGSLSTETLRGSATPWVLTASAITLSHVDGDLSKVTPAAMRFAFQQWGFTSPKTIANWPQNLPPLELEAPLGFNIGTVEKNFPPIEITAANISCAACHSSVNYLPDGTPDLTISWLGTPNASINLEGYPQAIYDSFLRFGSDDKLMQAAHILFPDLTKKEKFTLEKIILPSATKRINELKDTLGRAVPFVGGYPGVTNGLDGLHIRLGLQDRAEMSELSAFNSIPNLDGHAFRTSFLNAGNYQIPNIDVSQTINREDLNEAHLDRLGKIVAFFTVPSMGVDLLTAEAHMEDAKTVMRYVAGVRTQPFPGVINESLAKMGGVVFTQHCASCHGRYDDNYELSSYPNYVGDVGSDTLRIDLLKTGGTAKAINETVMGQYIHSVDPRGYSAPALNGIWASAPYMHNGSIPTLSHLFNPETRPDSFYLGGQRLNFEMIGIDGQLTEDNNWEQPEGYTAWSNSVLFDTSKRGQSAKGHEMPFDKLSDSEKQALLEYLKKL